MDSVPAEMIFRALLARVVEWGDLIRLRTDAGEIGTFVQVAVDAGETEVRFVVAATVLERADVLDVEGGEWRVASPPDGFGNTRTGDPHAAGQGLAWRRSCCAAGFELLGFAAQDGDEFVRPDVSGILIAFLRREGVLGVLGSEFFNARAEC
jgi:hypothetical protein